MLPPVSPVTATDASFSMSKPPLDAASPLPALPTAAQAAPADVVNLSSNTGIRAVSGELQVSNHVSVLAETLGKLLNIPRLDGEAAEAYVNRLVESIKALPSDQQAALEKALGGVLRGITLDMLSNALKSSAGPEAARLAVMFELSRSSGTSQTSKPSIPSYLQDILPDSPVIPQIKTSATTANKMAFPQVALAAYLPGEAGGAQSVTPPSVTPQQSRSGAIVAPSNLPTSSSGTMLYPNASGNTAAAQGQRHLAEPVAPQQGQRTNALPAPAGLDEPAVAMRTQVTDQQRAALSVQQQPAATDVAAQKLRPTQTPMPTIGERQFNPIAAAAFYNTTPKDMERLLLVALLGNLPEQAENITPQVVASLLTAQDPQQVSKSLLTSQSDPNTESVTQADDDNVLAAQRQDVLAAQRNAVAQDIRAALLEQPALHSALAAIVVKEAIPLPYVPYPAAKDDEESDAPPRGRMHSSQDDSGSADDSSDQNEEKSTHEERTAANDEMTDQSLSEGENNDGAVQNAESYYLRMSGFS